VTVEKTGKEVEMAEGKRLSKVIAARGVASRREAETMIAEGRVTVNSEAVTGVVFVESDDEIKVDGKVLPLEPPRVYFLLYKPRGYITGRNDPEGRKSVLDLVKDLRFRVEPVGRLDFDTEGALLLTNDGELANQLTHPSRKVPKRYLAKVYRTPTAATLKTIEAGVHLEDGRTHPAKARVIDTTDKTNAWVEVTVTEGRYRLIRRMFAQLGHPVSKLRRESFGTISLRNMERGQLRPLTKPEVTRLQELARGVNPSKAGKKKGKGFAKAKPKRVRPGYKKKQR
jgi:23S rRNA pseudouridine2605 synthase